jgi:polyvinyl alcohol dehydrogenase (cytochrome)
MRRPATLMFLLCLCSPWGATVADSVDGIWQGTVHMHARGEDVTYRIVLTISSQANGPSTGTLDSPDAGTLAIPLQSLKTEGTSVSFELADHPKGSFDGTLSADHAALTGNWKQDTAVVPLTLQRVAQAPDFRNDGSYLFNSRCTSCHTPFNPVRAPWPNTLKLMQAPAILHALEIGKMSAVGSAMSHEQRVALADYLGAKESAQPIARPNVCKESASPSANSPIWNGWGVDLSNTRFQTAELAGLSKFQLSRLRLKWAFGYPGATSAGGPPTIVVRRLFVPGGDGRVYSLDLRSGCIYWSFLPDALARTAITISPDGTTAYFGDMQARAYAIKTADGTLLWKKDLDSHPFAMITGAPKLYDGKLYVPVSSAEELAGANPKYPCCSFRGSVSALDANTGALLWKTYTISTPAQPTYVNAAGTNMLGPSGAGIWSSPTIDPDRHALYVGTGDNYSDPASATSDAVLALDLNDGKVLWSKQLTADDRFNLACFGADKSSCPNNPGADLDIGASPILRHLKSGKSLLLVGQKSGIAYALDPDAEGAVVWESRIGRGGALGGIEFGGAASDSQVYFPLSDWAPDPKIGGGLVALDIATGKKIWSASPAEPACLKKPGCSAAQPAPATAIPGVVFSGSLDGHLRAYDELDGKVLWDVDTAGDFPAVNGFPSHGGSLNYAGPVVAAGMLFVPSGYSINTGMPGNVLLAFSVDGK